MNDKATEREQAIVAADETCPRCGAHRQPDQGYCLDCGLRLPAVTGRVASLRRRWIRRFGWYPGDWIWISLLTLLVAIAGASASIALKSSTASAHGSHTFIAPPPLTVTQPRTVPATTTAVDTSTLPTPPEPTTTAPTKPPPGPENGKLTWPANENGWTIVLVSYPKTNGAASASQTAAHAAKAGLLQVGVLDSSTYASLQPGYLVVFTGIYSSKADADAAVSTARQAGFGGAYSRQIAR
jgi:cell division septation protein DedD